MSLFTLLSMSLLVIAGTLCHRAAAANSDEWRARSIYQVMTDRFALSDGSTTKACDTAAGGYCGGTWQGITNQLDYIQGMGFDAIWISPITAQLQGSTADGSSYHGYWQQDLYSLNPEFGTPADLQALAAELHARNMFLMVDVVTNHFAYHGQPSAVNYTQFQPFNKAAHFHTYCPIDFDDVKNTTNIETCWEGSTNVPLPDLKTEHEDVRSTFASWIADLVTTYSIDGLRIDSAMEVDTGFWSSFLTSAGVYAVGEVCNGDSGFVSGYQNYLPGVLNYGTYFPLIRAFQSTAGSMSDLANMMKSVQGSAADPTVLGTFSENHDQPRFASLSNDLTAASNVLAFTVLSDGIPIVYQGQEQHFAGVGGGSVPYNREALWLSNYNPNAKLYKFLATANAIRKIAMAADASYLTSHSTVVYTDTTTLAFKKGQMFVVLSNEGSTGAAYTQQMTLPSGSAITSYMEVLTCTTLAPTANGTLTVPMAAGSPRIYYPSAALIGSGLCSSSSTTSSVSNNGTSLGKYRRDPQVRVPGSSTPLISRVWVA